MAPTSQLSDLNSRGAEKHLYSYNRGRRGGRTARREDGEWEASLASMVASISKTKHKGHTAKPHSTELAATLVRRCSKLQATVPT